MQLSKTNPVLIILSFFVISFGLSHKAESRHEEPRGEIRVVENWRPNDNVSGHNVLQYLFEYANGKNELAPSLEYRRKKTKL